MKKLYTILLCVLLALMALVGLWSLVDIDATESETENRKLAAFPKFSLSGLMDGSFVSELEVYYSDTFPGREGLLKANKVLNKFYYFSGSKESNLLVLDFNGGMEQGGESLEPIPEAPKEPVETKEPEVQAPETQDPGVTDENTEPVVGPADIPEEPEISQVEEPEVEQAYVADGSLVIVGDNAMDIPTASEKVIRSYAEAINNIHTALGDDVKVISLLTPNSAEFYAPKDYQTASHDQQKMIDLCYENMDEDIVTVDAYSRLDKHQKEYIFFRTDHHWTALGAYYAYQSFCESMNLDAVPLQRFETGTYENFLGSMYTWTSQYPQSEALKNNPDTVTYYLPVVETHAKYYADADVEHSTGYPVSVVYRGLTDDQSNKYMCFLGGDHPATVVECDVEGPTCLVLKESYGNAFIPFLTSHYSKIIVIDPREFNRQGMPSLDLAEFVKEQAVDEVIVINYPFMINNEYYITWLNRLVGIDL